MALLLVLVMFAGCAKSPDAATPTPTPTPAGSTDKGTESASPADSEPPQIEDEPGYKYAAGKFEKDSLGCALDFYEYDVPFCTTDEVLTYWTTNWTPQVISEDGFTSMPFPQMLIEETGVHVEWVIAPATSRREQFATLLASDSLFDMMGGAMSFYPGTPKNSVEDGYFVNLYDYLDYIPNYTHQVVYNDYDKDVYNRIFFDPETVVCFYGMVHDPTPKMGYCIRGDFLDKLGIKGEDLKTYDQVHDALVAIKNAGISQHPMDITKTVEMDTGIWSSGLDTYLYCNGTSLPNARVVDGKVQFTLTEEDDRYAMNLLSSWYADGLINPNWASVADSTAIEDRLGGNESAYCFFQPSGIASSEAKNSDPDCRWDALIRPRKVAGEALKIGTKITKFSYGGTAVSAKCENIKLAASWCDWFYSETGAFKASYGPQGLTWDYNENGDIRLTEFVTNDSYHVGVSWMMANFALNGLSEHGMMHNLRSYAVEGGDRLVAMLKFWTEPTGDVAYDWPASCKFTDEENEELNSLSNDLVTYIGETWTSFIDGSRPMSEWDSYVAGAYNMGMRDILDIYQASYERFLAS